MGFDFDVLVAVGIGGHVDFHEFVAGHLVQDELARALVFQALPGSINQVGIDAAVSAAGRLGGERGRLGFLERGGVLQVGDGSLGGGGVLFAGGGGQRETEGGALESGEFQGCRDGGVALQGQECGVGQ